jgi:hypothetical protein
MDTRKWMLAIAAVFTLFSPRLTLAESLMMTVDSAANGLEMVLKDDTKLFVLVPEDAPLLFQKLVKQCSKGIEEKRPTMTTDPQCSNCLFVAIEPGDLGSHKYVWHEGRGFALRGTGAAWSVEKQRVEHNRQVVIKIYDNKKLEKVLYESKGMSTGRYGLSRVIRSMCAGVMHHFPEELADFLIEAKLRED